MSVNVIFVRKYWKWFWDVKSNHKKIDLSFIQDKSYRNFLCQDITLRVSMILSYIESRFSMTANHKSFQNQWQRIMRRLPHKMHLWQMLFNERYSRKLALFSSFGFYLTMLVFRSKKNTIFCVYWDLQNFFDQNICVTHWNFKKKNTWGQILEKPVLENFLELI